MLTNVRAVRDTIILVVGGYASFSSAHNLNLQYIDRYTT